VNEELLLERVDGGEVSTLAESCAEFALFAGFDPRQALLDEVVAHAGALERIRSHFLSMFYADNLLVEELKQNFPCEFCLKCFYVQKGAENDNFLLKYFEKLREKRENWTKVVRWSIVN
jgi:hypothetical protein